MVSCPKIAGGGRHHSFSKLLEIKGYEVFRVDKFILRMQEVLMRAMLSPALQLSL
jgi:hypothetical protein